MDIFKLVGSVFVDTEAANNSLAKTGAKAEETGGKLGKVMGGAAKVGAGIAAGVAAGTAALVGLATSASESLDAVQKGAQQMDMSYESYQKLSYACDRSGLSIDNLSKGTKNITKDMADAANGVKGATDKYDELGVSLKNADGTMRSTDEVLQDTLFALADMEDTTQRNALAADMFGASYQDMLPLLNSGSEGIKDLMQNAEDLGLVMSDEAVDAGAAFGDQMADVKDSLASVATQVGAQVMPLISDVLKFILDHMPEIQSVITSVVSAIKSAIEGVRPVIEALMPLVANVFDNLVRLWNTVLQPVLRELVNFVTNVLQGSWAAAFNNMGNIVRNVFNGLVSAIKAPLNSCIGLINSFLTGIGSIKAPDWVPVIGGKEFKMPQLPMLAKGGDITSGGAAIVGEAGAELINLPAGARVTPLNGDTNIIDYDRLADAIARAMQSIAIETNVVLAGDAGAIFDVVRKQNETFTRSTGRSAFA